MLDQQTNIQTISTVKSINFVRQQATGHFSPTTVRAWQVLQKASVKLVWVMSLIVINISGQSAEASNTKVANKIDTGERIVCLSTSGNGFNWAASFTWAAEMLRDAVAQAPQDARFNVACISGASSGSAFVAAYGSLLQNQQLFSRPDFHPQNITIEEAKILSKSLLYMALAADFRPEVANFYTSPDGDSQPKPPWWKSQFSLERVMLDFGTRVMLAQHISLADINQIDRLDRFIRYQSLAELETAAENKEVRDEYRQVTFDIWSTSQAIIDRLYQNANYPRTARQEDRDDFRDNPQHPVRQALAQQPANGILALTYAELAYTKSTVDYQRMRSSAPPFETLVPFVFTNEATAQKIIRSPFYREQVKGNDPYVGQYVISVVPDYYTMLYHAVKEPDLLPVGIHRLSPKIEGATADLAAGVSQFYQPIAEEKWQVNPRFKLIPSTRSWFRSDDSLLNARMGVAGGWVDSYVGGQATLYLGSSYAAEKSSSSLYYSTFSRQDSMTEFARNVVKKYFAPENSEQAIETIEKHRDHLPVLMERYQEFHDNHEISWQPIFVDWAVRFFPENQNLLTGIVSAIDDILKLGFNYMPVAITRQSNYLLARTMNVVRQTVGTNDDLGYIYDRSYEDSYYKQVDRNQ